MSSGDEQQPVQECDPSGSHQHRGRADFNRLRCPATVGFPTVHMPGAHRRRPPPDLQAYHRQGIPGSEAGGSCVPSPEILHRRW